MGVFSPAGAPSPASVTSTGSKTIRGNQTETITFAATETAIVFPNGLKAYRLSARGNAALQIASDITESATNYETLPCGAVLWEDGLGSIDGHTLYIQSSKASTIVEIVYWT